MLISINHEQYQYHIGSINVISYKYKDEKQLTGTRQGNTTVAEFKAASTYLFDVYLAAFSILSTVAATSYLPTGDANHIIVNFKLVNGSSGLPHSELNDNGISVYTDTIISDWGGRLELEIDRKGRIWVRVSRQQKLSILVLLSAMGLNIQEILENACYPELFLSFLNDKKIGLKENAILEFYQQFACAERDPVFSESLSKDLQKKFFQQRCELGGIGRRNMNGRLNLDIPQNNTFMLPRDILAAADRLIRIKFGMGTLDDMNHLQNKRIRSVADLLQEQFGLALVHLMDLKDLIGTVPETKLQVLDVGSYGKDITVGATIILANVSVFTPKLSKHYLNITKRNVVTIFRKDTVLGSGSG
ncbi:RNA polymerase beta subunit [Tanacetum coccineum]